MKRTLAFLVLLPLLASAEPNKIVLYDSYGSLERAVITGRVIESTSATEAKISDGWFRNLWRNIGAMMNSEKEGVAIELQLGAQKVRAKSDEEGYFQLTVPAAALASGWQDIMASGKNSRGAGRLLIVPKANSHGVISDIDDTVVVSDVLSKKKLLENTFLENPLQRKTFVGTAAFYKRLLAANAVADAVPMFYLSASPRQLAENISAFLVQNEFPKGALITKQISGADKDPLLDQQKYKAAKIEAIFAAMPWVKFNLIGDDGEKDPEIYRAVQEKFPARVANVFIRKVNPDPARATYAGQLDLAAEIAK